MTFLIESVSSSLDAPTGPAANPATSKITSTPAAQKAGFIQRSHRQAACIEQETSKPSWDQRGGKSMGSRHVVEIGKFRAILTFKRSPIGASDVSNRATVHFGAGLPVFED
jgi:hypothetical protein